MLTDSDLKKIKEIISPLEKDMKVVKKKVTKIEVTVDMMSRLFDEADVRIERRVKRIEQHLSLEEQN